MLGIGRTGWIEKPRPKCGPLDAIVRPVAVAPCASDIRTVWEGALGERFNMILGHEAAGVVDEVGSLVRDFKPGDRVIVSAVTPERGELSARNGCPMHSPGMPAGSKFSDFKDGVFAEYFHVNNADANLALLPKGMDPGIGAMISDMMPTGFHAVELADVRFGDDVAVIGIGPAGLMAVAGCVLRGAANIYCTGSRPRCRDVAMTYGASRIIDNRSGNISEQIRNLTGGRGEDRVCVTEGGTDTFDEAVRMLKPGGCIGAVNDPGGGDSIGISRSEWSCGMSCKTIRCGRMPGGRLRSEKLAAMVTARRVDPSLLVTHKFRGFEHLGKALELMRSNPPDLIKPVIYLD